MKQDSAGVINPQSYLWIYLSVAVEYQAQLICRAFKVWPLMSPVILILSTD
jgi:hypothetical protein